MKYNSEHDEYVAVNAWEWSGHVEAPTGSFASVALTTDTFGVEPDVVAKEAAALQHYGTPYLLVHESNEGFVTVTTFDTEEALAERYDALSRAYRLWDVGTTDDEARDAIDGYMQAAIFTGTTPDGEPMDGLGLSWSSEAQRQVQREVKEFLIQNANDIDEWLDATKHEWLQVGIDFWLTRNREGSGFWDRVNAGEAGVSLTEAAHAWGEQSVTLDEHGEVAVA